MFGWPALVEKIKLINESFQLRWLEVINNAGEKAYSLFECSKLRETYFSERYIRPCLIVPWGLWDLRECRRWDLFRHGLKNGLWVSAQALHTKWKGPWGGKSSLFSYKELLDAWPCLFWEGEVVSVGSWGRNGWDSSELSQCCGRPHQPLWRWYPGLQHTGSRPAERMFHWSIVYLLFRMFFFRYSTWEPEDHILDPRLVVAYEEK